MLPVSACSAQDANPSPADSVTLTFDWPVGLSAHVTGYSLRVRSLPDPGSFRIAASDPTQGPVTVTDTAQIDFEYDITVHQHAMGRRVAFSSYEITAMTDPNDVEALLFALVGPLAPDYIVSTGGELVDVEGGEEISPVIRDFMRSRFDSISDLFTESLGDVSERAGPPFLDQFMEQANAPELVLTQATQEWARLVGVWANRELEIGATFEVETEVPVALFGKAPVRYRQAFSVGGRVPCFEGGADDECVELIMRVLPDPEAFSAMYDTLLNKMLPESRTRIPLPKVADLNVENESVLVATPDGLIPYRLTVTTSHSTTMTIMGGNMTSGEQRVLTYRYVYGNPQR